MTVSGVKEFKPERVIAMSEQDGGGCWVWKGGYGKQGYGRFYSMHAHRYSYRAFRGAIPEGLEIDHLCRNIACVNPDHLEPVTRAENIRRRYALQTQCLRGHAFTPANTYTRPDGRRSCRACCCARSRAYVERKRAK